jgi:hypothetical protein
MVDGRTQLHVMCERDVGLFSLVHQVIANVPWAPAEGRTPVVCFGRRTSPGHYAVDGGTARLSELRARNSQLNSATIFHRCGPHAKRIDQLVEAASAELAATPTVPQRARPPDQN